jgi:hypothetical protein
MAREPHRAHGAFAELTHELEAIGDDDVGAEGHFGGPDSQMHFVQALRLMGFTASRRPS